MARGNESRRPPRRPAPPERAYRTTRRDRYDAPRSRGRRPSGGGMSFSASVVAALFFGFVLVYITWSAYGFFRPSILTEVVRMNTMAMQNSVQGMIIRYERVYYSEISGHAMPLVGNFQRIRQGDVVFVVQDADAGERNIQSLARVENEIMNLHDMNPDPAVAHMNSRLFRDMDRSMSAFSQSGLQDIYALLDNVRTTTETRNQIMIGHTGTRADLAHEHALLLQYRDATTLNIYAGASGIMSPFIDEFVGEFTPYNMLSLTHEQINLPVDHTSIIPVREVDGGDRVFKTVGNTWYVVTFMPFEMINFAEGQTRTFYLENMNTGRFEAVPMYVQYISDDHREPRVILRSNRFAQNFLNQRNVNIRTSYNVQSGLRIPVSAISSRRFLQLPMTHVHQTQGGDYQVIYIGDAGLTPLILEVHSRGDDYILISFDYSHPLRFGDLLTPVRSDDRHHNLSESDVRVIHGVYRTNLDFADFRQIHIDGEILETDNYILLDPARNPNIRQFDTIAIDAALVRQGQVIN